MSDQPDLGDIHDSRDRCEGTIPRGRAVEAADPTAYFSLGKEIAVCRKGISGCLSEGSQHGPFRCWQMTIECTIFKDPITVIVNKKTGQQPKKNIA